MMCTTKPVDEEFLGVTKSQPKEADMELLCKQAEGRISKIREHLQM